MTDAAPFVAYDRETGDLGVFRRVPGPRRYGLYLRRETEEDLATLPVVGEDGALPPECEPTEARP